MYERETFRIKFAWRLSQVKEGRERGGGRGGKESAELRLRKGGAGGVIRRKGANVERGEEKETEVEEEKIGEEIEKEEKRERRRKKENYMQK